MEVYADVIRGAFRIVSNGGNGFKGQDGGPGANAADSSAKVTKFCNNNVYFLGRVTVCGNFIQYRHPFLFFNKRGGITQTQM